MEPEREHHCLVRLQASDDAARVQADELEPLMGGPLLPEGRGDWWLAEELLVAAVGVTLLAAVRDEARRAGLPVGLYTCVGEAVVHERDQRPLGGIVMRISVEAAAEDLPRLDAVVRRAKEACVLARALPVPIDVQLTPVPSEIAFAGSEARSR